MKTEKGRKKLGNLWIHHIGLYTAIKKYWIPILCREGTDITGNEEKRKRGGALIEFTWKSKNRLHVAVERDIK